ncbi:MAG: hypothetical protein GXP32_00615 [Kiritimatiellaeota bacterium]|nr:hypothetical protein [Kiritimatiellota bacterium]
MKNKSESNNPSARAKAIEYGIDLSLLDVNLQKTQERRIRDMKKMVRIGRVEDQDEIRREDIRKMSPNERVASLLELQRRFFNWDSNPRIERVAAIKRIRDV